MSDEKREGATEAENELIESAYENCPEGFRVHRMRIDGSTGEQFVEYQRIRRVDDGGDSE